MSDENPGAKSPMPNDAAVKASADPASEVMIDPPRKWEVRDDHQVGRWEIGIPENHLAERQAKAYKEQTGQEPKLSQLRPFSTYVLVSDANDSSKRTTRKCKKSAGGWGPGVGFSRQPFRHAVKEVNLDPGSAFAYRMARLHTNAGMARLLALLMAISGAAITAAFGIGKYVAVVHWSHHAQGLWLIAAAVLTAAAAVSTWLAGEWFKDDGPR